MNMHTTYNVHTQAHTQRVEEIRAIEQKSQMVSPVNYIQSEAFRAKIQTHDTCFSLFW